VLSAVDVGSLMNISVKVELNVSSVPTPACYKDQLQIPLGLDCMPTIRTYLSVTNNNR